MNWIKRHAALVALLVVLSTGALLFLTGRLAIIQTSRHESERAEETGERTSNSPSPSRVHGDKVVLEEEAFKLSGIRTAAVSRGSVPLVLETPGEVQLAEDRIAHVTPQLGGIVRAVYRGVGDRVQRGSALCLIESVELGDARASYVAARAEARLAEQNEGRLKQLFEKGLRTQNELIAAEADLTRAKLKLEAASAKLRGLGFGREEVQVLEKEGAEATGNRYTLKSPIGGSILQRNVTVGQTVAAVDQLFFVGDLSEVWVQAVAHEQDLPAIRTGATALIHIPNVPEATFPGKVVYIGEQVDEKTRTVPLRILAKNPLAPGTSQKELILRPGLFTNIDIETARRKDVLMIPFAAVQSDGNDTLVFVQIQNSPGQRGSSDAEAGRLSRNPQRVTFERKSVELGVRAGRLVEVKNGLQVGEVVAVEGSYLLKAELEKSKLQD